MIYTSFLGPFLGMFLCKSHKKQMSCVINDAALTCGGFTAPVSVSGWRANQTSPLTQTHVCTHTRRGLKNVPKYTIGVDIVHVIFFHSGVRHLLRRSVTQHSSSSAKASCKPPSLQTHRGLDLFPCGCVDDDRSNAATQPLTSSTSCWGDVTSLSSSSLYCIYWSTQLFVLWWWSI